MPSIKTVHVTVVTMFLCAVQNATSPSTAASVTAPSEQGSGYDSCIRSRLLIHIALHGFYYTDRDSTPESTYKLPSCSGADHHQLISRFGMGGGGCRPCVGAAASASRARAKQFFNVRGIGTYWNLLELS